MNRRTFLKSAFVFILGLLGLKSLVPTGIDVSNWRDGLWVAHYKEIPQPPQIEFKPYHVWATTGKGEILVCTFDQPDEPIWKAVSKVGDV